MRAHSAVAALLLIGAAAPAPASASPRSFPSGSNAVELVRNFWGLVAQGEAQEQTHPKPRAIPPAPESGPAVDLTDLSDPIALEARLKPALNPKDGEIRLTIPGGSARLGDYSVGSTEVMTGPLLVVHGDADVYGRLMGNLVTVDGDVVVHPGALVSGDILALGGEIRDMGGEIGGESRTLRSTTIFAPAAQAAAPPPSARPRRGLNRSASS